jgi:hypothetical protein
MPPYSPYISKDFVIEGSFLRLDDKEKAWLQIDGRMRTAIRKAQKSGIHIRKTKGTDQERKNFMSFCLNPDDVPEDLTDRYHFYLAELGTEVIAGILVVEIGSKLFMLCHASTPKAKELNVPSLLIWHVAEEFMGGRFRFFDIGASYRASLQSFFSGWRTRGYPILMRPPELRPSIMLTPFDTAAYGSVPPTHARDITRTTLEKKFAKPYTFVPRATYAIFTLIKHLKNEGKIPKGGNVWVTTTTDTNYISSCVTTAIEQSAPVSRSLSQNTCAIFVIHEFGFPHPNLAALRQVATERNIPLIEDCAYGWGTQGIGTTGDYAIYSLSKAFPIQFGGYLVGKHIVHEELWKEFGCSDPGKEAYTEEQLAVWLSQQEKAREIRRANYAFYENLFGAERTYFPLSEIVEPGVFILKTESEERMQEVSSFVKGFGIECGNYWKNSAIILPVHQRLTPAHRNYIAGTVFATEREWCGVPEHHA